MSTDVDWEQWGRKDPYFGVLTQEKFRSLALTEEARREFFESGSMHVNHVLAACRHHLDAGFAPRRVLDFGCGVGRLVIPFAAVAEQVVGLDVSDSMLEEARRNCAEQAIRNVSLLKSDDTLSAVQGPFDLIHSFIVFQHIPVERGKRLFVELLSHLAEGGIAAVQFSYSKTAFAASGGLPPTLSARQKLTRKVQRRVRIWRRAVAAALDIAAGRSPPRLDPGMQMNPYNVNELLFSIQAMGVQRAYLELVDHGGELGVFLYFQKPRAA
jgi:SAM-dependent methyltransferase